MGLENIRIVLVSPMYGGNVGSVCRSMANMGLSDLAIAAPRPLDRNEAKMMACHAGEILESRTEYPTLADAVSDCSAVAGATARAGLYREHAKFPREMAPVLMGAARTSRVALVFGREDNGLANEEIALCTHILRIPTTDQYKSLNVAQAVMVCCYELFLAAGEIEPLEERSAAATSDLKERMYEIWRRMLLDVGFMKEDKAEHMMHGVRRVLSRGAHTENDVRIMMGVARQMEWAAGQESEVRKQGE